jgi:hypothetical protein
MAAVPPGVHGVSAQNTLERTPAMAAGLTDHPWTMEELLRYQVPPARWVAPPPPKRRGRPPEVLSAEATA